ncbi:MAG: hypothetical protein QOE79_1940 [Sphingomonadales bacterium]|jgi:hypothetical protein|nr:hypothetical protein [Sphingomonadales bacterium]MEA3050480.1 hypothetical protein [Sphingomonadales bacterium]
MRITVTGLAVAAGLVACAGAVALHWIEHPGKICAARRPARNPAWNGKPGLPCPPP